MCQQLYMLEILRLWVSLSILAIHGIYKQKMYKKSAGNYIYSVCQLEML